MSKLVRQSKSGRISVHVPANYNQWCGLVALALVLYMVVTGKELEALAFFIIAKQFEILDMIDNKAGEK